MEKVYSVEIESPVGRIFMTGTGKGVCSVFFVFPGTGRAPDPVEAGLRKRFPVFRLVSEEGPLREARLYLKAYFNDPRGTGPFEGETDPGGTVFQKGVWRVLRQIRPGSVLTYSEAALRLGRPGAARAVGAACGANPLPLITPCHRVVGSGGRLGGFGGGLEIKKMLLAGEGWTVEGDRIFSEEHWKTGT